MSRVVIWQPQPGPQERFIKCPHFEVLYGGAAGGGKTEALIHDGLAQMDHPQAKALFLRETFPQLAEVIDRTQAEFAQLGATWRASEKRWVFPSGAIYQFGFCGDYREVMQYQGQEFSWIGYDEIGNLPEERIWLFLLSRLRTKHKALKPYARCSANPGGPGHAWLKKRYVDPTRGGAEPYKDPKTKLVRHFIPSRVSDNPAMLESNPFYVAQLEQLPEMLRRQMLDGDWNAGTGLAFGELEPTHHFVAPFEVPSHWYRFAGFDWGFSHPWWYVQMAQSDDGRLVVVTHVVRGRRQLPDQIASRIVESLGDQRPHIVAAGHDCWHQIKARGESGPTIAERLHAAGLPLVKATISRRSGYQNLLWYVAHRGRDEGSRLKFFSGSTPIALLFEQLQGIVLDPDDPEDTLKVDADEAGEGGDDGYDALRYGMMLRPYTAPAPKTEAWRPMGEALGVDTAVQFPLEDHEAAHGGQWLGST